MCLKSNAASHQPRQATRNTSRSPRDSLNLPPHGQPKQREKVDQQDGPINRDIRRPRRRRSERQQGRLGRGQPEFEFR